MVEEELNDRHEGERLVKINLNSSSPGTPHDTNMCNMKHTESPNVKSVLKASNTSDSSLPIIGDRTRIVGFKLDKECQTDSGHKHASVTSQTSTDDEDITSPCSCLDNHQSENTQTLPQINSNECFHASEHFKYIDSNGDEIPNVDHNKEFQRGFDLCHLVVH